MKTIDMRLTVPTIILALALSACTKKEPWIEGTVSISPEIAANVSKTAALYVIARPIDATGGAPLAVQRLLPPFRFPVEFRLTSADLMVPDTKFEGSVRINVRLSQSGSAAASSGDIESADASVEAEIGSDKKLNIELSRIRPE